MNKKQLSERDICTKYITPALESAGWDLNILVDQTMTNDFEHFGSAMTKIQKRQANKSYSRSKPLTIAEFDLEKGWWGGAAGAQD